MAMGKGTSVGIRLTHVIIGIVTRWSTFGNFSIARFSVMNEKKETINVESDVADWLTSDERVESI